MSNQTPTRRPAAGADRPPGDPRDETPTAAAVALVGLIASLADRVS